MRVLRGVFGFGMILAALFAPGMLFASDTILIHGHIYTGNPRASWAQALAITGTKIDAVGTDEEILTRKQPKTEVIDLHGRTVILGISSAVTNGLTGAVLDGAGQGGAVAVPLSYVPEERISVEQAVRGYTLGVCTILRRQAGIAREG